MVQSVVFLKQQRSLLTELRCYNLYKYISLKYINEKSFRNINMVVILKWWRWSIAIMRLSEFTWRSEIVLSLSFIWLKLWTIRCCSSRIVLIVSVVCRCSACIVFNISRIYWCCCTGWKLRHLWVCIDRILKAPDIASKLGSSLVSIILFVIVAGYVCLIRQVLNLLGCKYKDYAIQI
jgi:hypothetical protein